MTRDASLDEFLGGSGEDDESEDGERESGEGNAETAADGASGASEEPDGTPGEEPDGDAADATDGLPAPDDVEPARSTYAWSPGGAECAACGATVTERWRDDGRQVCADCKDWAGTPD